MNRLRPVDYYDEELREIDEEICMMISKRQKLSNNPGFPQLEYISNWSKKYKLYESFLFTFFRDLLDEDKFRPVIQPKGFRAHIPVFKSYNEDKFIFTIPFLRQYSNASVLNLNVDWDTLDSELSSKSQRLFYDLDFGDSYECRNEGGSGNRGHQNIKFVVTPPLPDDLKGIEIKLRLYLDPHNKKQTGSDKVFR